MADQRAEIVMLGEDLTALLENSETAEASMAIASLMVAAMFARRAAMPSVVAAAMLSDFYVKGALN